MHVATYEELHLFLGGVLNACFFCFEDLKQKWVVPTFMMCCLRNATGETSENQRLLDCRTWYYIAIYGSA